MGRLNGSMHVLAVVDIMQNLHNSTQKNVAHVNKQTPGKQHAHPLIMTASVFVKQILTGSGTSLAPLDLPYPLIYT